MDRELNRGREGGILPIRWVNAQRQPQVTLARTRLTCFIYAYNLCISNERRRWSWSRDLFGKSSEWKLTTNAVSCSPPPPAASYSECQIALPDSGVWSRDAEIQRVSFKWIVPTCFHYVTVNRFSFRFISLDASAFLLPTWGERGSE